MVLGLCISLKTKKASSGQFSCALDLTLDLCFQPPQSPSCLHTRTQRPPGPPNLHWDSDSISALNPSKQRGTRWEGMLKKTQNTERAQQASCAVRPWGHFCSFSYHSYVEALLCARSEAHPLKGSLAGNPRLCIFHWLP